MNDTLDGEFQKFSVAGGAYIREHFFGPDQRLRKLVEHLSDDDLAKLRRGGHDYRKVYAAYKAATEFKGAPTVILAKTVKGWTLGPGVEARNITHQAKKLSEKELRDLPRPAAAADPRRQAQGRAVLPPRPQVRGGPVPARAPRGARRRRSRSASSARSRCRRRRPRSTPEFAAGSQTAGLDDDGLHPDPAQPDPRQGARAAHRADHPRRGAHVRHGPAVQGGRHLRRPRASATSRSTPTSCSRTARRPTARSSRRASPRPARWPRFQAAGTSYATPRPCR